MMGYDLSEVQRHQELEGRHPDAQFGRVIPGPRATVGEAW